MILNLIANLSGKGWTALMALIFTPFYLTRLGVEGYGLIGFFNSLIVVSLLLDLGLSGALNREFARLSVEKNPYREMRNLLKTFELISWGIAISIGLCVMGAAPLIAKYWFQTEIFSVERLSHLLIIMGLALALQWPFTLYANGLAGLQKQVRLNAIIIICSTLRYAGGALALLFIAPRIEVFFYWQLFISFFQTALIALTLKFSFTRSEISPTFDWGLIKKLRRFALGMGGFSATALIFTQLDKLILSKLLSLEDFGYYSLAWMCANGLYCFFAPLFSAFFPRFSQLVALKDEVSLIRSYHQGSQLMSIILLPVAFCLCLFSKEILFFWTQDPKIVENCAHLVSVLILGTTLHGLMQMPFALQFAFGWTRLAFYQNLGSLLILAPLLYWGVHNYGAIGGTLAWVILNFGYIFLGVHLMHRKLIPEEKWRWCFQDILLPLVGVLAIFLSLRQLFYSPSLFLLISAVLVAMLSAFALTPLRKRVLV